MTSAAPLPLSTAGLLAGQNEAISFNLENFLPMSPDSAYGAVDPSVNATTPDDNIKNLNVALPSPTDVSLHFRVTTSGMDGVMASNSGAPETSCT